MASLVADYTDSDSDEEYSDANEETPRVKQEPNTDLVKQEPDAGSVIKSTNFFESTENNSDDNEEDSSSTELKRTAIKVEIKSEPVDKLPNPLSDGHEKLPSILEATTSRIGTSVFVNPFEEAEQAKNQILEKHVKLTQAAPKKPAHQPVCWKFKKGKCHMGKNCRFFHDRENQALEENNDAAAATPPAQPQQTQRDMYHPSAYFDARRRPMEEEPVDDDNYMASMKKKKRFGVNDHLVPPKKAFESLQRQRAKERPWTMTQK